VHLEAGRALDIHEEAVGAGDQALHLVLGGLDLSRGEQKVLVDLMHAIRCHSSKHGKPNQRTFILQPVIARSKGKGQKKEIVAMIT